MVAHGCVGVLGHQGSSGAEQDGERPCCALLRALQGTEDLGTSDRVASQPCAVAGSGRPCARRALPEELGRCSSSGTRAPSPGSALQS